MEAGLKQMLNADPGNISTSSSTAQAEAQADSSIISLPPTSSDPSQLQLVLRTSNHAAFYDRSSRLVTLHASSDLAPSYQRTQPPQSQSLALLPHQPAGPLTTTSSHRSTTTIATSSPPIPSPVGPSTGILKQQHTCPTCLRPLLPIHHPPPSSSSPSNIHDPSISTFARRLPTGVISAAVDQQEQGQQTQHYVAPNYFRLLASASVPPSRASSRPGTPIVALVADDDDEEEEVIQQCASESDQEDADILPLDRESLNLFQQQPQGFLSNTTTQPIGIPSTPPRRKKTKRTTTTRERERLQASQFSQGYFDRFFVRVRKLGRGARGTVWLCQHILGGQKLGEYAVKQVPVGDYADNLMASLKEVQMLETLRHPNIIHYQHAWIEEAQMSPFAPRVPTLHVLMMAANGGSLADWISARAGNPISARASKTSQESERSSERITTASPRSFDEDEDEDEGRFNYAKHVLDDDEAGPSGPPSPRMVAQKVKIERLKKAVRLRRIARRATEIMEGPTPTQSGRAGDASSPLLPTTTANEETDEAPHAQHLLGEGELFSLLRDMSSGLGWLHEKGVLHLDVKPENVLLHWEQADDLLPRAMLSDFGSSTFLQGNWRRIRSGHTGTMDFMAPEAIFPDPHTGVLQELTSKSDIWSLGMILHLCVFFRLPYRNSDDIDRLREEMERYGGYSVQDERTMHRARVPPVLSMLLRRMLDRTPSHRPSCEEILGALATASAEGAGASSAPPGAGVGSAAAAAAAAASGGGGVDSPEVLSSTLGGSIKTTDALTLRPRSFVGPAQHIHPSRRTTNLRALLTAPEQRWVVVLGIAVLRSAWMESAVVRGWVGAGAGWACGIVGLIEVALA
ncbi:hypothetical protein A4X09_0g5917 [Tilletia walkeri]|uniref:Protein kinase domain-containing protein n=1 Tax=Tilletia walkeri TaxID=117179 RepID=A0A8X7T3L0_9BASI|nr:hypothetical protein A4X09_0g5917 [Tilletia walkeri]